MPTLPKPQPSAKPGSQTKAILASPAWQERIASLRERSPGRDAPGSSAGPGAEPFPGLPSKRQPRNRTEKRTGRHLEDEHSTAWLNNRAIHNRLAARERDYVDQFRKKAELRGKPPAELPPIFPIPLWRSCDAQMHDTTGRASLRALDCYPPVWRAKILRAALGDDGSGECARDLSHPRARAIIAFAISLLRMSRWGKRKGKWSRLCLGVTVDGFGVLIQGSRSVPVHRNTISGIHRAARAPLRLPGQPRRRRREDGQRVYGAELPDWSGQLGYLQALERVGLVYAQVLPAKEVTPCERFKKVQLRNGKPETVEVVSNRYWLCNPNPYDGHIDDDTRRKLVALCMEDSIARDYRLRPRKRPPVDPPVLPAEPEPPDD